MSVINHTPYKADSIWGRDKEGVHEWIVAVKGTFDIKPNGSTVLAEEQLDPFFIPEYHGEDGQSSVRYDTDLTAMKPTTDVLLNATAFAPNGRPSTNFLVSFRVGPVHKTIRALGNRWWEPTMFGSRPSAMQPVTEVPIVYERAYGGFDQTDPDPRGQIMDTRNPVGCGVAADADNRIAKPVHNFEYPKGNVKKTGPAGFGAIDSFWSPRRELQGTYDQTWQENRLPLLPENWDTRSLQCAPIDQQPSSYLRGGEFVELINLTPGGVLRFNLPKANLTFSTRFKTLAGIQAKEHQGRLTTLIIEPDHLRVIMVWMSTLTCRTDVDYLEETVVREKLIAS